MAKWQSMNEYSIYMSKHLQVASFGCPTRSLVAAVVRADGCEVLAGTTCVCPLAPLVPAVPVLLAVVPVAVPGLEGVERVAGGLVLGDVLVLMLVLVLGAGCAITPLLTLAGGAGATFDRD